MGVDYRVRAIYEETITDITTSQDKWKNILRLTGQLYRFEFDNILMIYAQRPGATLVADYDTWKKVDRYVKRGSKGIAIFPSRALKPYMRYVFDIGDTGGRNRQLTWDISGENLKTYLDYLVSEGQMESYKIGSQENLKNILKDFTRDEIRSIMELEFEDRITELTQITGSGMNELSEETQEPAIFDVVEKSIMYAVGTRCGFDLSGEEQDFSQIVNISDEDMIYRLGSLVCDVSCNVLRVFSSNCKTIENERRKAYGNNGNELPRSGGSSVSEHSDGGITGKDVDESGQIRTHGDELSEGKRKEQISDTTEIRDARKVSAIKNRIGAEVDNGHFAYVYDELNRLTEVHQNDTLLRKYSYDAFGNRISKANYTSRMESVTSYTYNVNDQLLSEVDGTMTKDYTYDNRGNLLKVSTSTDILKEFTFDATNQMIASFAFVDGQRKKATYTYNGLGHRVGQNISSFIPRDPERKIRYTIDMTRQYYNLLQKSEDGANQMYYWDGNVVGMESNGIEKFYLQDDLGSPMHLVDIYGTSQECFAFDEFGENLSISYNNTSQAFGFTGYQTDKVGNLYYAQARRYDASAGRFVSEDKVRGLVILPYTLNHYGYCWNNPEGYIDLDGRFAFAALVGAGIGAVTGIAAQAISDLCTGQQPSLKNYVSSAVGGAAGGAVMGLTGNAALAGAASSGTTSLISGVWDMADGTTEVTGGNVVGLVVDTGVSAGIGALFGKVTDVIGEKVLNKLGKPITDKLGITGRNSWTSLYKQVDTKIHNGTWNFSSLSIKTWFKSIGSESFAAVPSLFFSQLENPVQNAGEDISDNVSDYAVKMMNETDENKE